MDEQLLTAKKLNSDKYFFMYKETGTCQKGRKAVFR